ncbi:MAG: DUF1080 domain-containing protein [Fimbriimonadaceae bacterium]|nr:DUF1080 domain-containing protein [Fimbriimonadaceae bacterium]
MASPLAGRWDLTVSRPDLTFPSWLELTETDAGWEGRFVGIWGSARPIPVIRVKDDSIAFSLPPQYEGFPQDLGFTGKFADGRLSGETNTKEGGTACWVGVRAPDLAANPAPNPGPTVSLIGEGLAGWVARSPEAANHWSNVSGELVNAAVGTDLISTAHYQDFRLVAEYSYPEGSNSGIYLRGRYEFQILDDFGAAPSPGSSGAIYGFLVPRVNAIHPFGKRNVVEITLLGRWISVVLNGTTIHDNLEIPGITGGAMDSLEGEPGPILLQGDHGPVTFHRLTLTPLS